ncbi:Auxin response factor 2B [Forsythia ovata]|uniref:Auxin response factor 2B n=1 Tax=Forsythia ovata TaxID=205694 RepID=A0ABD1P4U1_9LAMI
MPSGDQAGAIANRRIQEHEGKFNSIENTSSKVPFGLSLNLMGSSMKTHGQVADTSYQTQVNMRYSGFKQYSMLSDHRGETLPGNWLMPHPVSPYPQTPPALSKELVPKFVFQLQHNAGRPKEGNCKLFCILLISSSIPMWPSLPPRN